MRQPKSKIPFVIKQHNHDNGYDIIGDYKVIIDSFLYQYNIYLPRVRNDEMSFKEFIHRLGGLDENAPLTRLAHVRLETDNNVVKNWPDELKAIRSEWQIRKLNMMSDSDFENHKKIVNKRLARFFESCATKKKEEDDKETNS